MSTRETVRRLRAFSSSRPLPRYSTKHISMSDNALIIAFVRMAGETRPWGIAYGYHDEEPKLLTVVDGRNRDDISEMLTPFAEDLLSHFKAEGYSFSPIGKTDQPLQNPPQIWLPGSSHVDMLHFLSYAFWKRRSEDVLANPLHALSRLAVYLFAESRVIGQQLVVDASDQLGKAYAYPTDDQGVRNLNSSLSWHASEGDYVQKLNAAQQAGSVATGITLDLAIEKSLSSKIDSYRKKLKSEDSTEEEELAVKKIIEAEISRRWIKTREARQRLLDDSRPVNAGVIDLTRDSLTRYYYDFQRLERQMSDPEHGPAYTPHPETENHGTAAASRYFRLSAANGKYLPNLIHDDHELFMEALAQGKALDATVTAVTLDGEGRSAEVYWTVRTQLSDEFRIRIGEYLSFLGSPGHYVIVEDLEFVDLEIAELTLKWAGRKTLSIESGITESPRSSKWEKQRVVFVPRDSSDLDARASFKVWKTKQGPGSWLTHSGATLSPVSSVVDDVTQLEG